jgi:ABC-type nitrate/sulfonate/bicarbonate transport system substrate-binding protein
MRRREVVVLVLAGAGGGLLTACSAAAPTSPPSAKPTQPASTAAGATPLSPPVTLTVTDSSSAANAALYIAMERGYFRDEGLTISTVNLSLDEQITALASGQLDVGLNSLLPGLLNAVSRGLGMRIIATAISHEPGRSYPIVARKDMVDAGQLNGYADLKGKRYATTAIPSIAVYAIDKAAHLGGLSLADLTLMQLSFPDIAAALVDILIKHTSVKDAAVYDRLSWAKMPENGEVRTDFLQEDVDWLVTQGGVDKVPDLSSLVDTRLTEYALSQLGRQAE